MRIGLAKRWRTAFYNHPVSIPHADTYSADEKLSLLTPLQIRSNQSVPELYASPADKEEADRVLDNLRTDRTRHVVAFSPVSRSHYKRWPAGYYAIVCDYLHETRDVLFLPLFGQGEASLVEEVIARARHPKAFLYPYTPISFGGVKVLIEHCLFYFGNDNGIRHIAIACGIPTAAIFGQINPLNWTPHGSDRHLFVGGQKNIASITPSQAIQMISQLPSFTST